MSVYIKGMKMPTSCAFCRFCDGLADTQVGTCAFCMVDGKCRDARTNYACPLVPVLPHGRLIDADALRAKMYHEAFETDSPMQKWDSGCWIRYKMFERLEENAPTIIPADPAEEGEG